MDLLTVLDHELGHVLGFEHQRDGVMEDSLTPGTRRLPAPGGQASGPASADARSAGVPGESSWGLFTHGRGPRTAGRSGGAAEASWGLSAYDLAVVLWEAEQPSSERREKFGW